ncbi:NitT/TauT family transport system permease protein [Paraburkholderia rhizosphaerae]|uniref:NitT/TauT family transport system permease protein n=1 Tax=Paraburkholderia rhizosphaerae TaxID=480658 RepID=A0A4R8LIF9_9BURK|nr:ABC transporter permease subunit [Paraburkholderia rhizosphaerae]TDY43207.1 NitT/TauT family transport system permease protein [Paraburkholderia rhizosphaerae]
MNFKFHTNPTVPASALRVLPNRWDFVAFPLIFCAIAMAASGLHQTWAPMSTLQEHAVSLSASNLPEYALRTTLRMLAAMVASLIFTLVYGTLAAKSRRAAQVLVPILDILQSVPVLGYISFTVTFFLALFPGRVLGAELATIFAIFTSQAWNMTFSFYQSLRTVPRDLVEVSRGFHLTGWQRFWKLEVPFAMPGLVWNMMMSMSGGWFFVVASEAITVGNHTIVLPGIGAYLAQSIEQKNLGAVGWAILAMTVVILAYDQFLFRPLVAWSDKFRMETTRASNAPQSWLLDMIRGTRLINQMLVPAGGMLARAARWPLRMPPPLRAVSKPAAPGSDAKRLGDLIWSVIVFAAAIYAVVRVVSYVRTGVTLTEVGHVFALGSLTLLRVFLLIAVSSLVWVPLGVLIGLRPALAEKIQPVAQFLAAFPANLLFPVFVIVIVRFHLNPDIWLSPLLVLGTQWYILFNVIAGASAYPNDYREAARNFRIRGWQWWRRVMLPGVFPYFITGAITASGGAWNASIVAEYVQWGDTQISAHGLGAYIAQTTAAGDFPKIVLGIAVMSLYVTLFNRALWRPLYAYAESRLRLD